MSALNSERKKKLGTLSGSVQVVNKDGSQRYPTYKGERLSIDGTCYEAELQKVTPKGYFKVEKF